jgi:glycosyltransferase XagB
MCYIVKPVSVVAGAHTPRPLGAELVDRGLVSEEDVDWALARQRETGSMLGSILVAAGMVRRIDLYRVLSEMWGCSFVDLTDDPIDPALLKDVDPRRLVAELWFPVRVEPDGRIVVATALRPTPERLRTIGAILGAPVVPAATSEWDIRRAVGRYFADEMLEEAALGLWRRDRDRSAYQVLNRSQRIAIVVILAGLVAALVLAPIGTAVVLSATAGVGFLVSVVFKFVTCMVGSRYEAVDSVTPEEIAALDDTELPLYTILVPVYHEANVVGLLMDNLGRLDYPKEKLEIFLLLEADDDETRQAAMAAHPPETVTFVTVPPGHPQTKPKACNVGLYLARGEFLVIYDAEDRPDPQQLKAAVVAFRRSDEHSVCVQAALNYFNAEENALTRLFTLEYSFWFDYMLPGLEALHLPIPLGGTSNHFRTQALRQLGGWDPFNVTEDADLGIRSAALGQTVGVIGSTTYEEANRAYGNFVRQRSRWVKGYLMTTLVHLRHPIELVRRLGLFKSFGFALLVGGTPIAFLLLPPLYILFIVSLVFSPATLSKIFPGPVLWMGLASFIIGNALMIYVSLMGVFKRGRYRMAVWALANPLYWLLHSVASYKALWQLIVKPHYWEKTVHGLTGDDPRSTDLP